MNNIKYLTMGHSERPHGIKGGFTLELYNHENSFLVTKPEVWLFPRSHPHKISRIPQGGLKFKIKSLTLGHKVILYLENIHSMNEAEELLPFDLKIEESLLPEVADDEIYLKDLFGLKVLSPEGTEIGILHEAYDNGSQMVLIIKKDSGELVDVPYVDQFVHELNVFEGFIVITLPDWNFS
jgi:16S rRNA processing protein RimM